MMGSRDDLSPPRGLLWGLLGLPTSCRRARAWSTLALPLVLLLLAGCGEPASGAKAQEKKPTPPAAVTVAAAAHQPITDSAQFQGRVVAVDSVDLRARVTGFLDKRLFTEGQDVKKGDLLLVIEKAPFQAAVEQQRAVVAQDQANLDNANIQLARAEKLVANHNTPQATVDDRRAQAEASKAELMGAQAALHVAEINLGYTDIKAPIDGRIGVSIYTVGNLVEPASGALATIVSQDPIYVTFPVSSRQLLEARRQAAAKGIDLTKFVVHATLPDGSTYPQPGRVDFLDIRVDRGTDTRLVRAQFPNPERFMVPGQFINVTVDAAQPQEMVVVPQSALQFTQAGASVLIVDGDSKVQVRKVKTGQMVGQGMVIASGLKAGERVIVEGAEKVKPGQVVAPATISKSPAV